MSVSKHSIPSDYQMMNLLIQDHCRVKYPNLYTAFSNLSVKQLHYLIPKMDRHSGTKTELVYYLLKSLKRKFVEDYTQYQNPYDFLFLDKVKLNVETIKYLQENKQCCLEEWVDFISNKIY